MVARIPLGMQSMPADATKQLLAVRVQPHHSKQGACTGAVLFALVNPTVQHAELMQRDKPRLVPHVPSSS